MGAGTTSGTASAGRWPVGEIRIANIGGRRYVQGILASRATCGAASESGQWVCNLPAGHGGDEHAATWKATPLGEVVFASWPVAPFPPTVCRHASIVGLCLQCQRDAVAALSRNEDPPAVTPEQRIATLEAALRGALAAMRLPIEIPPAAEREWLKALEAGDAALEVSDG